MPIKFSAQIVDVCSIRVRFLILQRERAGRYAWLHVKSIGMVFDRCPLVTVP